MSERDFIPELDSIISQSENDQKKKRIVENTGDWLGKNFRQYKVIKKLGEGAMAEVFKIHHPELNRFFALKLTGSSLEKVETISDQDSQRFLREAQVSFDLKHPNIVRVVDVGSKDGRSYMIMDYVEGSTLQEYIEKEKPSYEECLKIFNKIAKALHYAHQQSIIHRDLKPGNVMVSYDKQKNLQPMLMDFGLAKPVDVDSSFTQTGTVLGTPSYMSPEQARGLVDEIGVASDVYGLGAILYNMLTSKPPFERKTVMATLMSVVREEVIPPSEYAKDLPEEIERICLKALQKNPKNRFQTVEEMYTVIEKYLDPQKAIKQQNQATIIQETASSPQQKAKAPSPVKDGLSKYKIQKELAKGGMGVVYLAQDQKLQRTVAIKVLHARQNATDKEKGRFLKEARMAAKLSHGQIITVYEVGECDKGYFIAMEYFPAKDLQELLAERGKFFQNDIRYTCKVITETLEALSHAHSNKVLHRDIKPANILLKGDDVKITDFGLATEISHDLKPSMFMGTPVYCSPEQIQSQKLDHRADIYSVGIVLYEMLTGVVPFKTKAFKDLQQKIVRGNPTYPIKLNKLVPEDLQNIILKAIDKKAENRYQNADEFRIDIQRFLLGKPVYAKPLSLGKQIERYFQQNKTILLSTCSVFLLIFAFTFLFSTSAEEKKRQEHILSQKSQIDDYMNNGQQLLKENKISDAIASVLRAQKILEEEQELAFELDFEIYKSKVDNFLLDANVTKKNKLRSSLRKIEESEKNRDWQNMPILLMELKEIEPEHPEIKRLEKIISTDRVEINFTTNVKEAVVKVYDISKSKFINFTQVAYEFKIPGFVDLPQDKNYLLEIKASKYFATRILLYTDPQNKNVYMPITLVSMEEYDKFSNMIYIPSAKNVVLGPKHPLPRTRAARFPLESKAINISHFLIDKYEVTNAEYLKYLKITENNKKEYWPSYWEDGKIPEGLGDHPVRDVTWDNAQAYAHHYQKELPTEEQLELAALGTDERRFPWGDISALSDASGNFSYQEEMVHMTLEDDQTTVPVGSKKNDQSPYGVMDLGGNVREWTKTEKVAKRKGFEDKEFYVTKGGGAYFRKACHETDQYPLWNFMSNDPSVYTGFRCVKEIKE